MMCWFSNFTSMIWRSLLLGGLIGMTSAVPAAPNVWLLDTDGRSLGAYEALSGDWTLSVTPQASGFQLVGESQWQTLPIPPAGVGAVLVNDGSGLSPARALGPAISFGGVGERLGDLDSVKFAQAGILPTGGTFLGTARVEVRALPAAGAGPDEPIELHVEVDGMAQPSIIGTTSAPPSTRVYLTAAGDHRVVAQATQGMRGPVALADFTLVPAGPEDRDTDGDGIPDFVEAALGLNPLDAGIDFIDSDGDGLSDFDELVRGSDPSDPNQRPLDTDGDGWSDFDEAVRGTDPNDPPELVNPTEPGLDIADRPRVSRLMAVEYVLGGTVYADNLQSQVAAPLGRVNLTDLYWRTRYDSEALPDATLLAKLGVAENDLPDDLQMAAVAALLDSGLLPPSRVPAEFTQVVRATASAGLVYRSWLPAVPDVTIADMPAWMQENKLVALDTAGWIRLYQQFLAERLVRHINLSIAPMDSRALVLLEGVLAWYAPDGFTGRILLGNPQAPAPTGAVPGLIAELAGQIDAATGESRALEDLLLLLESLADEGGLLESFGSQIDALFSSAAQPSSSAGDEFVSVLSSDSEFALKLGGTSELDAANLIQGGTLDTLAVYLARLVTTLTPEEQTALLALAPALFADPLGDYDGDGVSNADELGAFAGRQTAVTAVDTDGDGYYDGFDPCPSDASNQCAEWVSGAGDSDGDGVVNFLDNCPTVANPDQVDTVGTGVGDLCRDTLVLQSPATDVTIISGMSVNFAAVLTGDSFVPPLSVTWDFGDVAPVSTALVPGQITFPTPGEYTVSFVASDAQRAIFKARRTITVLGSVVTLTGSGGEFEEGTEAQLVVNATSTAGTLLAIRWQTGDGASLLGASVQHVYASEGTYAATVEAVDINGFTAALAYPVTITDSIPVPSIGASILSGPAPLTVQFTDESTAWDGIAAREWDFGGGNGDTFAAAPSATFEAPGQYTVTLAVTDGDGSVALTDVQVVVGSAAQVPTLPVPFRALLLLVMATLLARQGMRRRNA